MQGLFTTTRFSKQKRPSIGQTCTFSKVFQLLENKLILVNDKRNGLKCTVEKNDDNCVYIRFDGLSMTDMTVPEFLTSITLTKNASNFLKEKSNG